MIDSPTKTTGKGARSLKEEPGVLTERQKPHLHTTPSGFFVLRAQHRARHIVAGQLMFVA